MDRRRLLRTLLNLGLGSAAATALAPSSFLGAGTDEVEIVYGLVRGDDPYELQPRTKRVPRGWYDELRRAFSIQEALLDIGFPGLVGAFVIPGDYDDPEAAIQVELTEESGVPAVKELLRDFDYTLRMVAPGNPEWGLDPEATVRRYADVPVPGGDGSDRARVPGGVLCSTPRFNGTLAPAMYDPTNRRRFFTTSNHLYGSGGTLRTSHRGRPMFLERTDGRTRIGRVNRGFPGGDLVRVRPENGYAPASRIDGASPSRVGGQFTKVGLADLYARGEPLEKVGGRTGHTSGEIKGINGMTYYYGSVYKRGQLKWGEESTITDGDSGSVSYHPDPERPGEQVLVAGFNNARSWWPTGDFTWGTAAYHVRAVHGFHF